jgi:hypothetical protein
VLARRRSDDSMRSGSGPRAEETLNRNLPPRCLHGRVYATPPEDDATLIDYTQGIQQPEVEGSWMSGTSKVIDTLLDGSPEHPVPLI